MVVTDATSSCALGILNFNSPPYLSVMLDTEHIPIQRTFQTTNEISWVLCSTHAFIFFGDFEFGHIFSGKESVGFKEIKCFVVNLVAMGDWGFLFCSSKLCFSIYIVFNIPHGDKMSKIQHKVCKTKGERRDHSVAWVMRNLVIKCSQKPHTPLS